MHDAATDGHLEIVKRIGKELKDKNPHDNRGITVLHSAAIRGHLNIVKYFIEELKIDPNVATNDGITAHDFASMWEQKAVMHYLHRFL